MFYRIFGQAGYGKTSYIYDRLSQCVKNHRKAFLIVPEQCALEAEKEVIRRLSGESNLYIEVINFKRLCNRVFRQLGGLTGVHLDDGARKMLMLLTLEGISPMLREYPSGAGLDDFCTKALSFCNSLGESRVTPSMLDKAADEIEKLSSGKDFANKLRDLALIAQAYTAKLDEVCNENSDMYERLCNKLRETPFFEGCDVFFDSFYGFTPREFEIISLIAEQSDNTYVTFACKKGETDKMFHRCTSAAKTCRKLAERCGCEVCDIELEKNMRHTHSSALYAFGESFRSAHLGGFDTSDNCDFSLQSVVCTDIHDEVKCAAMNVHRLVREGAKYRDIAICARNTADYIGVIDTSFEKAGIPLGIDIHRPFGTSALYELVLSALEGASTFACDDIIRYIKTGISGLDEEEADTFELYLRVWNVTPSHFKRDEDFAMNPDGYVDGTPDEYTLKVVNSARSKVFICLDSLRRNLAQCKTVKDFSSAVYGLLTDIKNVSGLDEIYDGADGEALELLCNMLDSFVSFGGDEKITRERFVILIKSCSKDYEYSHIPAKSDEVRFSDVTLMRASNVKHIIVLGANSGVFPAAGSDGSLVTANERKLLKQQGIELEDDEEEKLYDELFLAYSAICSASKSTSLSYCAKSLSGENLYPSVLVASVEKITGNKTKALHEDGEESSLCYAGDGFLFDELSVMADGEKRNTLIKYFSTRPQYAEKLDALLRGFSQKEKLDAKTLRLIYGSTLVTSYSRLEKFKGCPFSHFCTYTLNLRPEPVAALGASEAGNIMHAVLEHLVPLLCKRDEDGNLPDEEKAKELVKQLLAEHLGSISGLERDGLPKRFVYLYNRLSRLLITLACNIVRELKVSKFVPCDFELDVSRGGQVHPVPIDIGSGCTLYIVGKIDRVDVYNKDNECYIRIVDYKTGKKTFKMKDIENGFNLQMLLYLQALRQGGDDYYGAKVVPAGVLYSNVVSSVKTLSLGDDITEAATTLTSPVSSGIMLDDEDVLLAMDSTEEKVYLPITSKNAKDCLKSLEEMGALLDFATQTASMIAREIYSGIKNAKPFDGKAEGVDVDPCAYCDMKSICSKEK